MGQAREYELSAKQVERILQAQAHRAVDAAFRKLSENKQSRILIQAKLKADLSRILKGEIVYSL